MGKNSKNSKKRSNKKSFFSRVCSDEDSNTKNKKTNKTLPQALWSILMLATVCLVVYGLLLVPQEIQLLAWLGRNKYMAWAATAIYLTCLVGGGIYSFLI